MLLCSIIVISPEFEVVSVGLNIIIPVPEICTALFHGSVVSLYLPIMLWGIGWIFVVFYVVLF